MFSSTFYTVFQLFKVGVMITYFLLVRNEEVHTCAGQYEKRRMSRYSFVIFFISLIQCCTQNIDAISNSVSPVNNAQR